MNLKNLMGQKCIQKKNAYKNPDKLKKYYSENNFIMLGTAFYWLASQYFKSYFCSLLQCKSPPKTKIILTTEGEIFFK